jgi:MFS family permease
MENSIGAGTPTWAPMSIELGFTYEQLNDSYAAGSAALCIGALLFVPFALKYGRRPIYVLSLALQIAVSIWAANIHTITDLILVSVFNCGLGALAEVLVQMTIADVFFVHERGSMNSLYVWIMLMGSGLAPVAAGYITVDQDWRWVWWWITILLAICFLLFFMFYEETMFSRHQLDDALPSENQPSRATNVDNNLGHKESGAKESLPLNSLQQATSTVTSPPPPRKAYLQKLRLWTDSGLPMRYLIHHSIRPFVVLFSFPAVLFTAVVYGMTTAGYQICTTVVATYMPSDPYNFDASQVGLMSIPPFIGATLAALVTAPLSDRLVLILAQRNKGFYEPEMRLWLLLGFSIFVPAGLLLFGYSLASGSSWVLVAVGFALFTFGAVPVSSAALTFVTDAYTGVSLLITHILDGW